jgi:signal transduction histidine kinase
VSAAGERRSPIARAFGGALILLGMGGVVIAAGEIALFWPLEGPIWLYSLFSLTGLVYLAAGLAAWWRRPSNHIGAIIVLSGGVWLAAALVNTNVTPLVAVGLILATVPLAVAVWLLHAFPSGRLRSAVSVATVVAAFVVTLGLRTPQYLFAPTSSGDVLWIADRPDLVALGLIMQRVAGGAVMLVTAAVLFARLGQSAPQQRRALAPLYAYGILAVLLVPLGPLIIEPAFNLSSLVVTVGQLVLLAGVPVAFVLAMLRGAFARTGEVEELGAWLGGTGSERMPLVNALRRTLGDETLVVVYWAPERQRFVDALGQPISLPVPGHTGRGIVDITLGDRLIAALVYDRAMNEDPELVRSAGRVAAIAIDNERLTAELIANQAALRLSRARIIEAGDRERRRIAQNLHDGIQVELVLLAIRAQELRHAGSAADLDVAATELRNGIDDAAHHLRELVHAVMPAGLIERGLTAAVEDLVDRMPLPTNLVMVDVEEPLSPTVGSTAYFVVAEALANAVKHAGASTLSVRLERTGSQLLIEVVDDGVGGAASGAGAGLRGLLDRVDVLGGQLAIDSPLGHGTRLVAELPCGS